MEIKKCLCGESVVCRNLRVQALTTVDTYMIECLECGLGLRKGLPSELAAIHAWNWNIDLVRRALEIIVPNNGEGNG